MFACFFFGEGEVYTFCHGASICLCGMQIPEVGQAVRLGATLLEDGIDLADVIEQTGIQFLYDNLFINGGNGEQPSALLCRYTASWPAYSI